LNGHVDVVISCLRKLILTFCCLSKHIWTRFWALVAEPS